VAQLDEVIRIGVGQVQRLRLTAWPGLL